MDYSIARVNQKFRGLELINYNQPKIQNQPLQLILIDYHMM